MLASEDAKKAGVEFTVMYGNMIYWMFLSLGIVAEVIATLTMRTLVFESPFYGQLAATVGISLAYYCIGKAVMKIPLGIAYAVWCGVGLAGISLLSSMFFDEPMPALKIAGLVTVGIGIIILNLDEEGCNEHV